MHVFVRLNRYKNCRWVFGDIGPKQEGGGALIGDQGPVSQKNLSPLVILSMEKTGYHGD